MFLTVNDIYYSFIKYNVWNVDSLFVSLLFEAFLSSTHPREWVWSIPPALRVCIILLRRVVVASRSRHLKRRRRGHLKSASLCCVAATNKKVLFCFFFFFVLCPVEPIKSRVGLVIFYTRKSRCTVSRCYVGLIVINFFLSESF